MKKTVLSLLLLLGVCSLRAETYTIGSAAELSALKLKAGDEVLFRSGEYQSQKLMFKGTGTADKPISLRAEKAGRVVLTGESNIKLSGSYLVVSGFHLRDITPKGSPIEIKGTQNRVTECVITGDNLAPEAKIDTKWVSMYGTKNRVDHCTFFDKKNIGCLLVVWLEKDVVPAHTIENNYFCRPTPLLDADGGRSNGQECIRIGTSDYSMQRADCVVRNNYFYHADGETEMISNKSCFNTYSNNLFEECVGALTLRHGNNTLVENNYFIGNGVKNTGGVRVIGDNQTVRGNYFENLTGTKYFSAICLIQGVKDSPLNRYFQVTDTRIEGNTIVNCAEGISVSYGASKDQSLPVITTLIEGNTIVSDKASNYDILCYEATGGKTDVKWAKNIVYGGKYKDITTKVVPMTAKKPEIKDARPACNDIRMKAGAEWFI